MKGLWPEFLRTKRSSRYSCDSSPWNFYPSNCFKSFLFFSWCFPSLQIPSTCHLLKHLEGNTWCVIYWENTRLPTWDLDSPDFSYLQLCHVISVFLDFKSSFMYVRLQTVILRCISKAERCPTVFRAILFSLRIYIWILRSNCGKKDTSTNLSQTGSLGKWT